MKPYDNPYLAKKDPIRDWDKTPYNINHKLVKYYNLCQNFQHKWSTHRKQQVRQRYQYLVYLNQEIREGGCFKKYAECPIVAPKQLGLFKEVA